MKPENNSCLPLLRVGILINPLAGMGGPLGHKGSDDLSAAGLTRESSRSFQRMLQVLQHLVTQRERFHFLTVSGLMGEDACLYACLRCDSVWSPREPSQADETREAARRLEAAGIDLLLFAGGDGTARNLCEAGIDVPVLGVPAGVKMHSGVFAVNPQSAAELVLELAAGRGVAVGNVEIRDLDEDALRQGTVRPRFYGELRSPQDIRLLQQVKCASPESDALVQTEIAAGIVEAMEPEVVYLFCPGTTAAAVMQQLGLRHTLLGIDAVCNHALLAADLDADGITALAATRVVKVVLTVTGGQGMLLGRGNQQLTPAILRKLGRSALIILATPGKLRTLQGRPLHLDTGDESLDREWRGLVEVVTGYESRQLCHLA